MKARKLELKEVQMTDEVFNSKTKTFEEVNQGVFSYRDILREIILGPGPEGSNSSEQVIKSVMVYGKLKDALKNGEEVVLLDKDDYDYILARINTFKWRFAHATVAEFIKYVRELAEVEVTEKKDSPKA